MLEIGDFSLLSKISIHMLRCPPVKLKLKIILVSTSSLEKTILTNLCLFYLGDNINKISITYHYLYFQVFSHLKRLQNNSIKPTPKLVWVEGFGDIPPTSIFARCAPPCIACQGCFTYKLELNSTNSPLH